MCPEARGTPGTVAPESGWAAAFQSRDSLAGLNREGLRGQAAPPARIHRGCRNGKDVEPAMMRRVRMNPPSQQAGFPNCQLRCAGLV